MVKTENFLKVEVKNALELRAWLEEHHTQKESVWLVTYKKEIAEKYVSVQEVALKNQPSALTNFDAISAASKRFMLRYIKIAKTPSTRAKRIEEIAKLAQEGKKLKGS